MTRPELAVPEPTSGKDGQFVIDFDTRVDRLDGEIVVTVLGEIDMATGPPLWECLATAIPDAGRRLVIDLSGTTFIDSTGMAVFMKAQKQLRHRGADLILRAPQASARMVLSITGLDAVIAIQDGSVTTNDGPETVDLRGSRHAQSGVAGERSS